MNPENREASLGCGDQRKLLWRDEAGAETTGSEAGNEPGRGRPTHPTAVAAGGGRQSWASCDRDPRA